MSRVLVVDDDDTVSDVVTRYLVSSGHEVDTAADGSTALALAAAHPPDLVILDLMLPGASGLQVCQELHRIAPLPVIMLTALGEESDRVTGLEIGADDYITKPFSPRELVLRVNAVLRRARQPLRPEEARSLVDGELEVKTTTHQATRFGEVLALTSREYDLLAFFLRNPNRAFSREELLASVWDWNFGDVTTVTVHVRRLREKIELDPGAPSRLITVWGVGYRYQPVRP